MNKDLAIQLIRLKCLLLMLLFSTFCTERDIKVSHNLSPKITLIGGDVILGIGVNKELYLVSKLRKYFDESNWSATIVNAAIRKENASQFQERSIKLFQKPLDYLILETSIFSNENTKSKESLISIHEQLKQTSPQAKIILLNLSPSEPVKENQSLDDLIYLKYDWETAQKSEANKHDELARLIQKAVMDDN